MSQDEFAYFQQLPRELRDEIWELAATRSPNTAAGAHYFSVHVRSQVPDKFRHGCLTFPLYSTINVLYLPPLLDPEHLPSSPPSWVAENSSTYAWPRRLASVCRESHAAVMRHLESLMKCGLNTQTEGRRELSEDQVSAPIAFGSEQRPWYDRFCMLPDRDFVFLQLNPETFAYPVYFVPFCRISSTNDLQMPKNIAIELSPTWLPGNRPSGDLFSRDSSSRPNMCPARRLKRIVDSWNRYGTRAWLVDRRPGNRQRCLDVLGRDHVPFLREQMGFEDIYDAAGCRYMTIPSHDTIVSSLCRVGIDWEGVREFVAGLKEDVYGGFIVGTSMGLLVCD